MDDLKDQRISIAMHSLLGVIVGYGSLYLSRGIYALGFAVIILLVLGPVVKRTIGKDKDKNWWLGNGAIVYLLIWFVSWVLLFNLVSPLPPKIF